MKKKAKKKVRTSLVKLMKAEVTKEIDNEINRRLFTDAMRFGWLIRNIWDLRDSAEFMDMFANMDDDRVRRWIDSKMKEHIKMLCKI